MVNQTANFDIPYLDGTELVRDYPTFSEDLANAVDDGLISARGLVAVKSALKTDTFTASVGAGGNVAVTDLSITHEVSDPANRLIISAFFGMAGNSDGRGNTGIAVHDGTGLIAVGASSGSRTEISAGGFIVGTAETAGTLISSMPSVTFVYTPGSGSKTYTVRAINIDSATNTIYINRNERDESSGFIGRGASSIVIQEVAV